MARLHAKRQAEQAKRQAELAQMRAAWGESAAGQQHQAELTLAEQKQRHKATKTATKKAAKYAEAERKFAEAERKKAAKKAEAERRKAEDARRPAGPMQNEMARVQAQHWQAEQAKRQAELAAMQATMQRQQQAEQAELAKLPLAERAAVARASPRWIPDAEASTSGCMICAKPFGRVRDRVQHCHYCGWAVCNDCSKRQLPLQRWLEAPKFFFQKSRLDDSRPILHTTRSAEALRVCDLCVEHRVDLLAPKRSVGEHAIVGAGAVVGVVATVHSVAALPFVFVKGVEAGATRAVQQSAVEAVVDEAL
jgi:flagellar biosynthesis GTPase FlhF